jgi:DNA repair protein RecN (Recombination protein N)
VLISLAIRNLATVQSLDWELGTGLVCLTGETGAGKSLLIDALHLLAGGKASADLVRSGADKAIVEAEFVAPQLAGTDERIPDSQVLLRREISAEGRSRAFINGVASPLVQLESMADCLFEIHGQHGQRHLLQESRHMALFDSFAELSEQAADLERQRRALLNEWKALDDSALLVTVAKQKREIHSLQLAEIEAASLSEEDGEIEARLKRAHHAEQIASWRSSLSEVLGQDLLPALKRARQLLQELLSFHGELEPYLEGLENAKLQFAECLGELGGLSDSSDCAHLEVLEARFSLLNRLFLKYGRDVNEVLAEAARLRALLVDSESGEQRLAEARLRWRQKFQALQAQKQALDLARAEALPDFCVAAEQNLRQLNFQHASFVVECDVPEWAQPANEAASPQLGPPSLRFLFSANAGEPPKPLKNIASGGELSRVMLALIAAENRPSSITLVFDEVDAGIGGETAHAVGQLLADISHCHQVLCVTHLAQVARHASQHVSVAKRVEDGRTLTTLNICSAEQRVQELARLLGGDAHSRALLEHAQTMLAGSP